MAADDQCWVELTRSQVDDLLSMVKDALGPIQGTIAIVRNPKPELLARRAELIILKGALLLGRDDPGATP